MASYVSERELDLHYAMFQNKPELGSSRVKIHRPLTSKLGIMQQTGKVVALRDSINFAKDIDASVPSDSNRFRVPKKLVGASDVDETPLPKEEASGDFDFGKLVAGKYSANQLRAWYERLTGTKPMRKGTKELTAELLEFQTIKN